MDNLDESLHRRIRDTTRNAARRVVPVAEQARDGHLTPLIDEVTGTDDRQLAMFIRHIEPGQRTGVHRHTFEALGYVLEGEGWDTHDGERVPWADGDALHIPANVWHQHHNASADRPVRLLLITNWPQLMQMGLCTLEPLPDDAEWPEPRGPEA